MASVDVLVVGSGGREHALVWKLRQSSRCGSLHAAPGNAGMEGLAQCHPVKAEDRDGIVRLARELGVGLVVVGPEAPLAAGLADGLRETGTRVFGPSAAAARIESSKAYARDLMQRAGVPQPQFGRFQDLTAAGAYLDRLGEGGASGAVVKANGLAAGKGAVVCDTLEDARRTAREMLEDRVFGDAGAEIVIEERLSGEEASLLVVTDGERVVPFVPAQDYKRVGEGDTGPNTGGMGCYAPAPLITPELYDEALRTIVRPTLAALAEDGALFQGCLFAGLMKTTAGLRVIEFNCRFGDPEAQVVLPLLQSDLLEMFLQAAEGRLEESARWSAGKAVSVVLASGGYPGSYQTGRRIDGLEEAGALEGVTVFHAGTSRRGGDIVTSGGRVLNVTGQGATFADAVRAAYRGVDAIRFEDCNYRRDIGARVVEGEKS